MVRTVEGTSAGKVNIFRSQIAPYLLAFSVGGAAIAVAFIGAAMTGDDNVTGGVNGFVEGLSGRSSGFLGDIGFLAPLGFAFTVGMVSTVNPCGFAMLPAYLGLYLGADAEAKPTGSSGERVAKALLIGLTVTAGFVLMFGVVGIIIGAGARWVTDYVPWIGLGIGIGLTLAGSWVLAGGKIYTALAGQAASQIGNPGEVSIKGYFLFGLSYGTASLSCTLPIFLSVVGISFAASEIGRSFGQFILYALGMGFVILVMTLGMALFREATVRFLRRVLRFVQPLSAAMMILAGAYIIFYWMTFGRGLL